MDSKLCAIRPTELNLHMQIYVNIPPPPHLCCQQVSRFDFHLHGTNIFFPISIPKRSALHALVTIHFNPRCICLAHFVTIFPLPIRRLLGCINAFNPNKVPCIEMSSMHTTAGTQLFFTVLASRLIEQK